MHICPFFANANKCVFVALVFCCLVSRASCIGRLYLSEGSFVEGSSAAPSSEARAWSSLAKVGFGSSEQPGAEPSLEGMVHATSFVDCAASL